MNYVHYLKDGDVLHCQGSRTLSKLIRWFTRSTYSHTALFITIDGNPFVIDAQKDGVQVRAFESWQKDYNYKVVAHRAKFTESSVMKLKERALSKVGTTAYDFEGLILKSPIELLTGKWKKKPVEDERMFCSEYVMWVFNAEHSYRMNPQDAYDWCWKNDFEIVFNNF